MKVLITSYFLIVQIVFARRGTRCTTPNNESGICIPIKSCPTLYNLIAKSSRNSTVLEFARQSQCGYDTEVLVCCSPNTPKTQDSTKILANSQIQNLPNSSICGIQVSDKIHGGLLTVLGEFPWVAGLEFKSESTGENVGLICGGSIINEWFILTAAHCLTHREFTLINIRLGEWDVTKNPDCYYETKCADPVQNFKIGKIILHDDYTRKTKVNDIALIKLEKKITYNAYIRPICLPSPDLSVPENGTLLTVSGWGLTENDSVSNIKLKVDIPVISHDMCQEQLVSKYNGRIVTLNQLCVGGEEGKDSCQGDSGGPLMRTFNNELGLAQWYQEGLVSWGVACGLKGRPGVYTRLSTYVNWIASKIAEN